MRQCAWLGNPAAGGNSMCVAVWNTCQVCQKIMNKNELASLLTSEPSWISFDTAWNQFLWSSHGSLPSHLFNQWTRNNFRSPNLKRGLFFVSRNLYLRNPQFLVELMAQRSWFLSAQPAHGHPLAGCNSTCSSNAQTGDITITKRQVLCGQTSLLHETQLTFSGKVNWPDGNHISRKNVSHVYYLLTGYKNSGIAWDFPLSTPGRSSLPNIICSPWQLPNLV